jgi:hypothetical protein
VRSAKTRITVACASVVMAASRSRRPALLLVAVVALTVPGWWRR